MSYCRCGEDSDIYLIESVSGKMILNICSDDRTDALKEKHGLKDDYMFNTKYFTLLFIGILSIVGFKIPPYAINRLNFEISSGIDITPKEE